MQQQQLVCSSHSRTHSPRLTPPMCAAPPPPPPKCAKMFHSEEKKSVHQGICSDARAHSAWFVAQVLLMSYFGCLLSLSRELQRKHTSDLFSHRSLDVWHVCGFTHTRISQEFSCPSPNGRNPICKPQLPQGLPVPVTGELTVFAGWLQHSCWLTHSPNCPWAPWNSQPIWLSAYRHTPTHQNMA